MILGYCRVSTQEQAAEGSTSLDEQDRRNRAVATLRGADQYDFVSYTDPGVSGGLPLAARPQGGKMLADARAGDCIVAVKMDRLFRSAVDALQTAKELKERGVDLILADMSTDPVTQNGAGKLFFGMLALVAEFERERIEERTCQGREAKKAKGGCVGQVPYGYRKTGEGREARLEPLDAEQQVIKLTRRLSTEKTPWQIAQELTKLGHVSRAGKPFQTVQVQRMLVQVGQ